jgi:quinol monooxygenase YgiN
MENTLTIIAHARAKTGLEDFMIGEQIKLAKIVKHTAGCLRYELHVSNSEPGLVTFVEEWKSAAHWHNHMQNDYLHAFRQSAGHSIAQFDLQEMHQVA